VHYIDYEVAVYWR